MSQVFQFKISLSRSEPEIWRRIQVSAETNLKDFHHILQIAMGWDDYHLFSFTIKQKVYQLQIEDEEDSIEGSLDIEEYSLASLNLAENESFLYEYDFGDGWIHEILLEKKLVLSPNFKHPLCLEGKRACPPEDCGGLWGFYELLAALKDKKHPEHKEMKDWLGYTFDEKAFSVNEVNEELEDIEDYIQEWNEAAFE